MKRIYRAINEGINKSLLITFGDDGFRKSNELKTNIDIHEFHVGDYVYKDPKLGYNNYVGEKVAICVGDDKDNAMYAVINHEMLHEKYIWAGETDKLLYDAMPPHSEYYSWEFTEKIQEKYRETIHLYHDDSPYIWAHLKSNEYIPSLDQLKAIYNNCLGSDILDRLGVSKDHFELYWTINDLSKGNGPLYAYVIDLRTGDIYYRFKYSSLYTLVLLNIGINQYNWIRF